MPVLYASAPPTKMVSMMRTFQKDGYPEPSGASGATAPGNLSATAGQSSGVHKVPAVNHGMPVPFSAVQAPVTPNMAHLPWMTSRSAFFSLPNGMIGDSPPPG